MCNREISPIETSFNWNESYDSVVDRYYMKKYVTDLTEPGDDYCILIHSNRVCLVTIAPTHNLLTNGKKLIKLDFEITDKVDRLSNRVSGKWKHGAQKLKPTSIIMFAFCEDGTKFRICSGITGKLLEINNSLLTDPNLLLEPEKMGYIAIVLPDIQTTESYRKYLLSPEEYNLKISSRKSHAS